MSLIKILKEILILPFLIIFAIASRFVNRKIDVGLGPIPLINNIYHKKALVDQGYSAETFVNDVYVITSEFDIRADLIFKEHLKIFRNYYLFTLSLFRYKCLYFYFNGGSLGFTKCLWRIEPFLYKLAKIKVVVMPYGADVQDMSRSQNLIFKHTMSCDYPNQRLMRQKIANKIDMWTKYADCTISGCDWVDYMYHWDILTIAHFSIDTERWKPLKINHPKSKNLRILHAPNHRNSKGTKYFIQAINELKEEGLNVELVILEKVPNHKVKEVMATVDVIADQLIIGWYAMFALEAMAMEKAVLCFIREDLEKLYTAAGLIEPGELPIINCSPFTVKEVIRNLAMNKEKLPDIQKRSREFVLKHHSTESIGKIFKSINESIGLQPSLLVNNE